MKNASPSIEASKPLNNTLLVIFDRFDSDIEESDDYFIVPYTKDDNISQLKNVYLRKFFNSPFEYCVLWKPEKKQSKADVDKIRELQPRYVDAINITNIPYFTGIIKPVVTIDYGGKNISIGTGLGQKVTIEALSKKAVETVGYFDVRMKDYSCAIDYAYRLSDKGLMPRVDFKKTPWLFDIESDLQPIAKPEMDEVSSEWYKYKHDHHPWDQDAGELEQMKTDLKRLYATD